MPSVSDLASKFSKRIEESLNKHVSEFLNNDSSSHDQPYPYQQPIHQQNAPAPYRHNPGPYFFPQRRPPGSPAPVRHPSSDPRKVEVAHVEYLGVVKSSTTRVERDLGFQGRLGDHILVTYGDTMFRDEKWSDNFIGMTCNSVAIATPNPISVFDPLLDDRGFPKHLLEPSKEYEETHHSLGITNVVELEDGRGG
jgi:hypothetical protein